MPGTPCPGPGALPLRVATPAFHGAVARRASCVCAVNPPRPGPWLGGTRTVRPPGLATRHSLTEMKAAAISKLAPHPRQQQAARCSRATLVPRCYQWAYYQHGCAGEVATVGGKFYAFGQRCISSILLGESSKAPRQVPVQENGRRVNARCSGRKGSTLYRRLCLVFLEKQPQCPHGNGIRQSKCDQVEIILRLGGCQQAVAEYLLYYPYHNG